MENNKFMQFLESFLLPLADALNNNRYLTALRDGFMVALHLIIFGSIFVVIANLPFLDRVISPEAFAAYQSALGPASAATLSIMGMFVIIGIGYKLTAHYGQDAIYGGVVALAAFLILTRTRACTHTCHTATPTCSRPSSRTTARPCRATRTVRSATAVGKTISHRGVVIADHDPEPTTCSSRI